MPVWSLTMVATKVTSRLLPGRTKASTECWGSEFLLKNIRQFQLWFPFHKETYFWFWILLLPVLHKSVSLQHWQHQTSLNSCPLVPRCPKFSCGGLSSCLLSFPFLLFSLFLLLYFLHFSFSPTISYSQQHAQPPPTTWLTFPIILKRRWDPGSSSQFDRAGSSLSNGTNLISKKTSKCQPRKSTAIVVCGGARHLCFCLLLLWFWHGFYF